MSLFGLLDCTLCEDRGWIHRASGKGGCRYLSHKYGFRGRAAGPTACGAGIGLAAAPSDWCLFCLPQGVTASGLLEVPPRRPVPRGFACVGAGHAVLRQAQRPALSGSASAPGAGWSFLGWLCPGRSVGRLGQLCPKGGNHEGHCGSVFLVGSVGALLGLTLSLCPTVFPSCPLPGDGCSDTP